METRHFHNTTNQDTSFVVASKQNNKSQEEIIFELFQVFKKMTASEVLAEYPGNIPLTSVRRSCSNLQYDNKLQITKDTKIGLYGKPEKYYIISNFEDRQFKMFN